MVSLGNTRYAASEHQKIIRDFAETHDVSELDGSYVSSAIVGGKKRFVKFNNNLTHWETEARALETVGNHEHLPTLYEAKILKQRLSPKNNLGVIVMDYCGDRTLNEVTLTPKLFDDFFGLVSALDYCKQKRVFHNDVSVRNIMFNGKMSLIDFDTAQFIETNQDFSMLMRCVIKKIPYVCDGKFGRQYGMVRNKIYDCRMSLDAYASPRKELEKTLEEIREPVLEIIEFHEAELKRLEIKN